MKTYKVETHGMIQDSFEVYASSVNDAINKVVDSLGLSEDEATMGITYSVSVK